MSVVDLIWLLLSWVDSIADRNRETSVLSQKCVENQMFKLENLKIKETEKYLHFETSVLQILGGWTRQWHGTTSRSGSQYECFIVHGKLAPHSIYFENFEIACKNYRTSVKAKRRYFVEYCIIFPSLKIHFRSFCNYKKYIKWDKSLFTNCNWRRRCAHFCLFLIAFLIVLQWKCENLLGKKQPKFTKTSTPQIC